MLYCFFVGTVLLSVNCSLNLQDNTNCGYYNLFLHWDYFYPLFILLYIYILSLNFISCITIYPKNLSGIVHDVYNDTWYIVLPHYLQNYIKKLV